MSSASVTNGQATAFEVPG